MLEPCGDLLDAETQRGGDAEDGAEDRDDVDDVTGPAFDLVAEQRFECPPDRQRAAAAVDGVGQSHTEHGIESPGVQTPVDEGLCHAHLGVLDLTAGPAGLRSGRRIGQGFGHTVEDEADAHAGSEEHGEPGHDAEFGFVVVLAELDLAELREADDDREADEQPDDEHVVPAELGDDPVLDVRDDIAGALGQCHGEYDDADDDDQRRPEDARGDHALADAHSLALQLLSDCVIGVGFADVEFLGQMKFYGVGFAEEQLLFGARAQPVSRLGIGVGVAHVALLIE